MKIIKISLIFRSIDTLYDYKAKKHSLFWDDYYKKVADEIGEVIALHRAHVMPGLVAEAQHGTHGDSARVVLSVDVDLLHGFAFRMLLRLGPSRRPPVRSSRM